MARRSVLIYRKCSAKQATSVCLQVGVAYWPTAVPSVTPVSPIAWEKFNSDWRLVDTECWFDRITEIYHPRNLSLLFCACRRGYAVAFVGLQEKVGEPSGWIWLIIWMF